MQELDLTRIANSLEKIATQMAIANNLRLEEFMIGEEEQMTREHYAQLQKSINAN
jgi:hypothetical protein